MARAGRLKPEDRVKQAGAGAWVRAGQLSGLFSVPHPADDPDTSEFAPLDFLADDTFTVASKTRVRDGSRTAEAVERQKYAILITAMAAAAVALVITTVVLVVATSDSGGGGADTATTMPSPARPPQVPSRDIRPAAVEKPGKAPAQVTAPAARAEPKPAASPSRPPVKLPATATEPAAKAPRKPVTAQNVRGATAQPAAGDPEADFAITDYVKPGKPAEAGADRNGKNLGDNNLRIEKQIDKLRRDKQAAQQNPSPDAAAKPDSQKSRKKNLSEELFEKPLF